MFWKLKLLLKSHLFYEYRLTRPRRAKERASPMVRGFAPVGGGRFRFPLFQSFRRQQPFHFWMEQGFSLTCDEWKQISLSFFAENLIGNNSLGGGVNSSFVV